MNTLMFPHKGMQGLKILGDMWFNWTHVIMNIFSHIGSFDQTPNYLHTRRHDACSYTLPLFNQIIGTHILSAKFIARSNHRT